MSSTHFGPKKQNIRGKTKINEMYGCENDHKIDSFKILYSNRNKLLNAHNQPLGALPLCNNTNTSMKIAYCNDCLTHTFNSRNKKATFSQTADNNHTHIYNISDLCGMLSNHESDVDDAEDIDEHKGLYFHKISRIRCKNTLRLLKSKTSLAQIANRNKIIKLSQEYGTLGEVKGHKEKPVACQIKPKTKTDVAKSHNKCIII